jgi:hypothetical protein
VALRTNLVCRYDEYHISGLLQLSGDRYETDWNIYPAFVILTCGIAEAINFPYTVSDLAIKPLQRYDFRVGYNCADALIAYERRRRDGEPARFVSIRGGDDILPRQLRATERFQLWFPSVRRLSECSVYVGGGSAIEAPLFPSAERRLSGVLAIMDEDGQSYSYRPNYVTGTSETILLLLQVEVENVTENDLDFHPLDIGFSGELIGLGTGAIPFAKYEIGWKKLRRASPATIPAGERKSYTYLFRVPESSARWRLTYQGAAIYDFEATEDVTGSPEIVLKQLSAVQAAEVESMSWDVPAPTHRDEDLQAHPIWLWCMSLGLPDEEDGPIGGDESSMRP